MSELMNRYQASIDPSESNPEGEEVMTHVDSFTARNIHTARSLIPDLGLPQGPMDIERMIQGLQNQTLTLIPQGEEARIVFADGDDDIPEDRYARQYTEAPSSIRSVRRSFSGADLTIFVAGHAIGEAMAITFNEQFSGDGPRVSGTIQLYVFDRDTPITDIARSGRRVNLEIRQANEDGQSARRVIRGVRFLNRSGGANVNDFEEFENFNFEAEYIERI